MSDPLRFFVPPESLQKDPIIIQGDAHHHLRNVLRVKPGARVQLLDGNGGFCNTEILTVESRQSTARALERGKCRAQRLRITLMQALPKKDKFDLVLQKGTELGVFGFQPVITENSIPLLNADKLKKREQRWQRIVSEAARQSRRYTVPYVAPVQTLEAAINEKKNGLKLVLWEAGAVRLSDALPKNSPREVQLLIGPEGGFTQHEVENVKAAGFQPVHLGPRILRTETAGLAATPILQYLYGDWEQAPSDHD